MPFIKHMQRNSQLNQHALGALLFQTFGRHPRVEKDWKKKLAYFGATLHRSSISNPVPVTISWGGGGVHKPHPTTLLPSSPPPVLLYPNVS